MRRFRHPQGMVQQLAVADLLANGGDLIVNTPKAGAIIIYSDPPWNPGNEKYWRRYAGASEPTQYNCLLDAWCHCVAACKPEHVFCEQSVIDAHRQLFIDAVARCEGWNLPLLEQWTVYYGSPSRPNILLHFGRTKLASNPEGLRNEAMTRCVFEGLDASHATIIDPCIGLGMTSRMAHTFKHNCVGTELNSARLERAIAWLLKHGYVEVVH